MIKVKISYNQPFELQKVINLFENSFKVVAISKASRPKGEKNHKNVYIKLENLKKPT